MPTKKVMDKLYYMSKLTGIPKSEWHYICKTSERSMYHWSYNPGNVSDDVRNKIEERIRAYILMRVEVEFIPNSLTKSNSIELAGMKWIVSLGSGHKYIFNNNSVGEFIGLLVDKAIPTINLLEEEEPYRKRSNESRKLNSRLWWIVKDKDLEMPLGITVWNEELLPKKEEH